MNVNVMKEATSRFNRYSCLLAVNILICLFRAISKEQMTNANFSFIHMILLLAAIQNGYLVHNFFKITIQFMILKITEWALLKANDEKKASNRRKQ